MGNIRDVCAGEQGSEKRMGDPNGAGPGRSSFLLCTRTKQASLSTCQCLSNTHTRAYGDVNSVAWTLLSPGGSFWKQAGGCRNDSGHSLLSRCLQGTWCCPEDAPENERVRERCAQSSHFHRVAGPDTVQSGPERGKQAHLV